MKIQIKPKTKLTRKDNESAHIIFNNIWRFRTSFQWYFEKDKKNLL